MKGLWVIPGRPARAAVGRAASARTAGQNGLQKNSITNKRKKVFMKTRQSSTRWLGLALACGALTSAASSQAAKPPKPPPTPSGPAYVTVALGGLRSSEGIIRTWAADLNNASQVVGYTSIPGSVDGNVQAFLLNPRDTNGDGSPDTWFADAVNNGTGTPGSDGQNDLIVGLGNFPGSQSGGATAVNDLGLVVGSCHLYDPVTQVSSEKAFIVVPQDTDHDGRADCRYQDADGDGYNDLMVALGHLPGILGSSAPEGLNINNQGQVVGCFLSQDVNGAFLGRVGFLLTPAVDEAGVRRWFRDDGSGANALMLNLGTFTPLSINESGQMAGYSLVRVGETRALLRNPDGSLVDLGAGGTESIAKVINNQGQIGLAWQIKTDVWNAGLLTPLDTDSDGTPDLWCRDANGDGVNDLIRDLGGVSGLETTYVREHGLNDAGSVVGGSAQPFHVKGMVLKRVPFLWQNGVLQTLKSLTGVEFWDVYGINNARQIICTDIVDNNFILLPTR